MTHAIRRGGVIENAAMPSSFLREIQMYRHNTLKIIVNIVCKKGTQTIIFVQLRDGIRFFNSRELSVMIIRENKLFLRSQSHIGFSHTQRHIDAIGWLGN